jgi:seryl-tRNA synthetase
MNFPKSELHDKIISKGKTSRKTLYKKDSLSYSKILEIRQWEDFNRIKNVSGERIYCLKNEMVDLEFALIRFSMDYLKSKGFNLITVPSLVNEQSLYAAGYLPYQKDELYLVQNEEPEKKLYLSGTSEVIITSLHQNEILNINDLPLRYCAFSPCFRTERKKYGSKGLIRVHQFMKVEQVIICNNDPQESINWHYYLLNNAQEILNCLELPHIVVECSEKERGKTKVLMHDIKTWFPSEKKYRETHSCSSYNDWQAKRVPLRYRSVKDDSLKFCHTINNTAIATPRILAAFIENHQRENLIFIPKCLRPYMNGKDVI